MLVDQQGLTRNLSIASLGAIAELPAVAQVTAFLSGDKSEVKGI